MTTLDDLPWPEPTTATTPTGAGPRHHRHHYFVRNVDASIRPDGLVGVLIGEDTMARCILCGKPRDEAKSRAGRQSRNYGNRAELDVARRYGGRKVGHAQGPTDVRGVSRKLQVKTSRRGVPPMWRTEFAKLDSERDGRLPILLLRFLGIGRDPADYFVIRASDFVAWYGIDSERETP